MGRYAVLCQTEGDELGHTESGDGDHAYKLGEKQKIALVF